MSDQPKNSAASEGGEQGQDAPRDADLIQDAIRQATEAKLRSSEPHMTMTRTRPSQAATLVGSPGSFMSDASSFGFIDHGRFPPGTLLGGRYRIVELLGKGGMGEVYRADDLKLGQSIALKFLNLKLAGDPMRIADMHNEVRIARQVSHTNVCRVYDIGEVDSHPFISMEYVDGENLASLLQRIGRLPRDKAVEIARQLCVGLAAAHTNGVLHRDLKPTNVMIDGRGRVRITDFGLAGFAEQIHGNDIHAGTPAYMAPEQLSGREVSVRSDVYSLGLVLYEMFTGKRAFAACNAVELARLQEQSTPTNPAHLVQDIDPVVERVIMRCLERDPRHRPPSALAVAGALPGGDPLAAALAAGETPSPEMVAAAGLGGGLRPRPAALMTLGVLMGVSAIAGFNPRFYLFGQVPLDKPPQVLAERARELLAGLGHTGQATDSDWAFAEDFDYVNYLAAHESSPTRWEALRNERPSAIYFWYRQSPLRLASSDVSGSVSFDNPPIDVPGMANVRLDPRGFLIGLQVVPAAEPNAQPGQVVDWSALFASAGLRLDEFAAATPVRAPPVFCDAVGAWTGKLPGGATAAIRVEAGAFHGRPVYFRIAGPWSGERESRMAAIGMTAMLIRASQLVISMVSLVGGIFLAVRNTRLARGDRRGAFRLALYVFGAYMLNWALLADHVPLDDGEWDLFVKGTGRALFFGAWVWMLYIALEPYVRRWWPDTIISWSRLLAGRFRDPLIGRDLLIGALLGILTQLVVFCVQAIPGAVGHPGARPLSAFLDGFSGLRNLFGVLLWGQVNSFLQPMFAVIILLLGRVVLKSTAAGVAGAVAVFTISLAVARHGPTEAAFYMDVAVLVPLLLVHIFVLLRFGLLAVIAGHFFMSLLSYYPLSLDMSVWYAESSALVLLIAVGLTLYGFWISLAGRPLIQDEWSPA